MSKNKFTPAASLMILLLVVCVLFLYLTSCDLSNVEEEVVVPAGTEVEFEITEGMTLNQVAGLLEEKGIIDNAFLFRLFVEQRGKEGNLIPGIYVMETNSGYEEVLSGITAGPTVV